MLGNRYHLLQAACARGIRARHRVSACLMTIGCLLTMPAAHGDPISTSPSFFFAGNVDYTITAGTLRTAPNGTNSCSVSNSSTATLSGIPAGATVVAAYLYWAGSGPAADNTVTFAGTTVSASRTFTETFTLAPLSLDFFSGFADVTALVSANGSYTFSDLTVTNTDLGADAPYCSRAAVLSGWGLFVVYERSAEPLRVINVYDGFQQFRGSQIQVSPGNFVIPSTTIDGKIAILTWEGDVENSAQNNNISENLIFDGQNTAAIALTDALNPLNNQFNSTVNINNNSTSYGVDFDIYDIDTRLTAGDTSATTTYASGGDLVLLSMQAVSTTNVPVVDLSLSKTLEGGVFSSASDATYRLQVSNAGPSAETSGITVTDTLPAGLSFLSATSTDANWSCSGAGTVTCTHPGPMAPGSSLADLMLTVSVASGISAPVINSATVSSSSFDPDLGNNTATHTASVVVDPDLSSSVKQVEDLNGGNVVPGDILRYRVNLVESGGAAINNLTLNDPLDSLLINPNVINDGGGVDATTATVVAVNGLSVPANGTVTVVFDVEVAPAASTGTVIGNDVTLSKPSHGISVMASAPDVTVGNPVIATSGIKPLYLGDLSGSTSSPVLPMELTRVPLTAASTPARVRIRRNDNDRVWRLSPVLASNLGLDTDPIPVRLFMRRNNNSATRNLRLTLTHGSTGTLIGCVDQAIAGSGANGLSNSVTRPFDFSISQTDANCNPVPATPLSIATGSFLELTVDNEPGAASGLAIFVYPFDVGSAEPSRLELPATTIINVDSAQWFDSAGAGTALTSASAGQTVYLRALVSDPFGSADITSASFQLFDATGASVATGSMTEIASTAGTKTYEVPYTLPPTAANGTWTLAVTATEGTEGTIAHTGYGTVTVSGGSGLRVDKTLTVISDPTASGIPKAIPGAEVEYRITVTNDGSNSIELDSIVIDDALPGELLYLLGNPAAPVAFSDGSPSSNLTFTFASLASLTDDVAFSNDGGATFVTPVVAADGSDATVPRINFIRLNPKGTMPGNAGTPPEFSILLRMRIP